MLIGLTGPSGSGKGVIAGVFANHGCPSVDADKVYHDLLIPPSDCLDDIFAFFGDMVKAQDGSLDRKALGSIVFSDKAKLEKLNSITHHYILAKTDELISSYHKKGIKNVIFDAPLLFESGYSDKCDVTVSVTAPAETRIVRIMERDNIDRVTAERRIKSQPDDTFYTSRSTYTLVNNGDIQDITLQTERLIKLLNI